MGFEMLDAAGHALVMLLDPYRVVMLSCAVVMGLVLGILPGIGGLSGTALLLPFTFTMDPYSAFALLFGLASTPSTGAPLPSPPAIPSLLSCSACPPAPAPPRPCSTACRWRAAAKPAARSAPPICRP